MTRSLLRAVTFTAFFAAPALVTTALQAMPHEICRARCNRHFNPADFPKWERWDIQKKFDQCMTLCRKSRE
jgi:hypothetical protein